MPFDDGANWGGGANAASGVDIEVQAASTPTTGIVRVAIEPNDTPEDLARKTANEWNARRPIADVFAIATANSGLTRFLHPGGQIVGIAATFDGKTRTPLGVGDSASSLTGDVSVQRVQADVVIPKTTA